MTKLVFILTKLEPISIFKCKECGDKEIVQCGRCKEYFKENNDVYCDSPDHVCESCFADLEMGQEW